MNIDDWLLIATRQLSQAGIQSSRLDAELILSHTVRKPRTYLHAHSDDEISDRHKEIADARLQMRLERTPIAYIIGHKDFYGYSFKTTPAALIPRPESENIINILKDIMSSDRSIHTLVDVGTGTGCLGITAKLLFPGMDVTLTDISVHALNLAKENAKHHDVEVRIEKHDLLSDLYENFQIIIANLPYVDKSWETSPELSSEPEIALFANHKGLELIFQLIDQAATLQELGNHLILESDTRQHSPIIQYASEHGYKHQRTSGLITYFTKE